MLIPPALGLVVGACSLDGTSMGPGGGDNGDKDKVPIKDGWTRIANTDAPEEDERLNLLGIACESTLTVTGSFTESTPQPADVNGCWGIGTWRITAAIDRQGCDPQPEVAQEFVYISSVDEETESTSVLFQPDPGNERMNLKITTDATGLCQGAFEHFQLDGTVLSFHTVLQEDLQTVSGHGTYSVYVEDPF